jgi:integrase
MAKQTHRPPVALAAKFKAEGKEFKPPKKGAFTDRWIDRGLPPLREGYVIFEAFGLGITVAPSGRKTFVLQTRYPGQDYQARRKLGTYPDLGLKDARLKAAEWLKQIKAGVDPADVAKQKADAAAAERRARALQDETTFGSVAERYIAEYLNGQRRAKNSAGEIRGHLSKAWGTRPIASITPRDVKTLIGKIKLVAPYQARNVFGHARTLFKWAVHEDLLATSPIASLEQRWVLSGAKIGPRQRVLDNQEIAAFWRAAGRLGYPFGPFFKLLLLTGVRVAELAEAKWSELHPEVRRAIRDAARTGVAVDWARVPAAVKVWTVPRERFKSDTEHPVQLSDDALAIFASLPRFSGEFIFSTTRGVKPINGNSKAKRRLDRAMLRYLKAAARMSGENPETVALPPFIVHDLRRVVRSQVGAIRLPLPTEDEKLLSKEEREKRESARRNIPDHICELLLGHGRKGLQKIYDMNKHAPEIREALDAWAITLRRIVSPPPPAPTADNVVNMPRQRKRVSS